MATVDQSKSRHLNRILSEIDEVYHEIANKQGYSDSAMAILYTLWENEGQCRLEDLIRLSGRNKQTVNSSLRKLEKEDILFLEPAGGRFKRVCLTEKGTALCRDTVVCVLRAENQIYSSWSETEWDTYVKLTERYLYQLREKMKELL